MAPPLRERLRPRWSAHVATTDLVPEAGVLASALFYLFTSGAVLALATLALPDSGARSDAGVLGCAGGALAVAGGAIARYDRLGPRAFPVLASVGTLLITLVIYSSGHSASVYALFYLWVLLFSIYFFSVRQVIVQMMVIAAMYGGVLATLDPASARLERWLVTVGTLIVSALLVSLLKARVEGLIARLAATARTDPLTGLLNRRGFQELFDMEFERTRRGGRPPSILMADLDHFKQVNDGLGHDAGDRALEKVATVLRAAGREVDTPARLGGEEFAVLTPETGPHDAYLVAERIRASLEEAFAGYPVPLTVSIGVASAPVAGSTPDEMFHAGDQALCAAKHLGRNRSVIHSPEAARLASRSRERHADRGEVHLDTLLTLAETLDMRDPRTARHSASVGRFAELMAMELGLSRRACERVRLAGVLHDIGKIGISDAVLQKPGPLTEEERVEMTRHPELGARILAGPHFADIRSWVLAHHERLDGHGYPNGLEAADICLEARILAVADAYEAMTNDRVYRNSLGYAKARQELREGCGTQFDTTVVKAFLRVLEQTPEPGDTTVRARAIARG